MTVKRKICKEERILRLCKVKIMVSLKLFCVKLKYWKNDCIDISKWTKSYIYNIYKYYITYQALWLNPTIKDVISLLILCQPHSHAEQNVVHYSTCHKLIITSIINLNGYHTGRILVPLSPMCQKQWSLKQNYNFKDVLSTISPLKNIPRAYTHYKNISWTLSIAPFLLKSFSPRTPRLPPPLPTIYSMKSSSTWSSSTIQPEYLLHPPLPTMKSSRPQTPYNNVLTLVFPISLLWNPLVPYTLQHYSLNTYFNPPPLSLPNINLWWKIILLSACNSFSSYWNR